MLQRPQEGEGRQGRRLPRSPVQRDRGVRGGAGQSQRSAAAREALPEVMRIVREVGVDFCGSIVSLEVSTTAGPTTRRSSTAVWFPTLALTCAAEGSPSGVASRSSSSRPSSRRGINHDGMRQIVPRSRIISAPLYQPSQTPTKTRNQLAARFHLDSALGARSWRNDERGQGHAASVKMPIFWRVGLTSRHAPIRITPDAPRSSGRRRASGRP
jgi:hypothetical protein